jgi:hypothetical protein
MLPPTGTMKFLSVDWMYTSTRPVSIEHHAHTDQSTHYTTVSSSVVDQSHCVGCISTTHTLHIHIHHPPFRLALLIRAIALAVCTPYALLTTWKTSCALHALASSTRRSGERGVKQLAVLHTHIYIKVYIFIHKEIHTHTYPPYK